jgi:hypothetical protein
MMKRPGTATVKNEVNLLSKKEEDKQHPKAELMSRLASGSKVEINKKDMLKLTNKNYSNLPEVK